MGVGLLDFFTMAATSGLFSDQVRSWKGIVSAIVEHSFGGMHVGCCCDWRGAGPRAGHLSHAS